MEEIKDILPNISSSVDALELTLREMDEADCKWIHLFTPGIYVRGIIMPVDSVIVSRVHKTEHPFNIFKGVVSVKTDNEWNILEAPFLGVTKPGTRRILVIKEECIWTTTHAILPEEQPEDSSQEALDKAVKKIEDRILFPPLFFEEEMN